MNVIEYIKSNLPDPAYQRLYDQWLEIENLKLQVKTMPYQNEKFLFYEGLVKAQERFYMDLISLHNFMALETIKILKGV